MKAMIDSSIAELSHIKLYGMVQDYLVSGNPEAIAPIVPVDHALTLLNVINRQDKSGVDRKMDFFYSNTDAISAVDYVILDQLIKNAEKGKVKVTVRDGFLSRIYLTVDDNGHGLIGGDENPLDPSEYHSIFELDSNINPKTKNIVFPLVKHLAESRGGDVNIASKNEKMAITFEACTNRVGVAGYAKPMSEHGLTITVRMNGYK
jgi:hypothetical protein